MDTYLVPVYEVSPVPTAPEDCNPLTALYEKTAPPATPTAPPPTADPPYDHKKMTPEETVSAQARPRRRRRTVAGCRRHLRNSIDGRVLEPKDVGGLVVETVDIVQSRGVPSVDVGDVATELVWEVVCHLWSEWEDDNQFQLVRPMIRGMCEETAAMRSGRAERSIGLGLTGPKGPDESDERKRDQGCCVVC
jgi:hypothetical protein